MVHRGEPSAACKECRTAKKRCDLTRPVCARCQRLKRRCSGPRDTSHYEFHDESQTVMLRSQGKSATPPQASAKTPGSSTKDEASSATAPESTPSVKNDVSPRHPSFDAAMGSNTDYMYVSPVSTSLGDFLYPQLSPLNDFGATIKADDLAVHSFLTSFTSSAPGLWGFIRSYALESKANPCLDRAVRACGMAAFVSARNASEGAPYARAMYTQALGLINNALSDPKCNTTDECLIAVLLMGYYEVITIDDESSFQSWKAHTSGLREMVKLRGRRQLESLLGRHLFREIEAHIITQAIWDAEHPPDFLFEWEDEFEALSTEIAAEVPSDSLTKICIAYARLKADLRMQALTDTDAATEAIEIANRLEQWSNSAMALGGALCYSEVDVPDSPHVWNGTVHTYNSRFAIGTWMAFRAIRILVSQTQEMLSAKLPLSPAYQEAQSQHCRKVQRETANDICAAVPTILDYSNASGGTECTVNNVYSVVWPLYLAGTCVLARCRTQPSQGSNVDSLRLPQTSASLAQVAWILGRMDYISAQYGLKWASVTATTLRSQLPTYC